MARLKVFGLFGGFMGRSGFFVLDRPFSKHPNDIARQSQYVNVLDIFHCRVKVPCRRGTVFSFPLSKSACTKVGYASSHRTVVEGSEL